MLLLEDRRFYVYIYLNQLKPGTFIYGDYCFAYEPFYVGRGQGKRYLDHIKEAEGFLNDPKNKKYKDCNKHKVNTINKINKILHQDPKIVIVDCYLTYEESSALEEFFIQKIGRKNLGLGPLSNLTDGGDGVKNLSIETKNKRINAFKQTIKNNDTIFKKVIESRNNFYKKFPQVNIDRINKMQKTLQDNPEINKNRIVKRNLYYENNPEILRKKEKSRISTTLEKYGVVNVFQTEEIRNKIKELNEKDPNRRKRIADKAAITRIKRMLNREIKMNKIKELNISFILNLYFEGLDIWNISKKYSIEIEKISFNPISRVLEILNLPTKNKNKLDKKIRMDFICSHKHLQQWYIDNYKRLEQEYFDRKFAERHPEFIEEKIDLL